MEIKEKLENYGDNPSSNWFDYVQDTMECLHVLLKKGIESKYIFFAVKFNQLLVIIIFFPISRCHRKSDP